MFIDQPVNNENINNSNLIHPSIDYNLNNKNEVENIEAEMIPCEAGIIFKSFMIKNCMIIRISIKNF